MEPSHGPRELCLTFCLSGAGKQARLCLFSPLSHSRAYPLKGLSLLLCKWMCLCLRLPGPSWCISTNCRCVWRSTPLSFHASSEMITKQKRLAEWKDIIWKRPAKSSMVRRLPKVLFHFFLLLFKHSQNTYATHTCKRIKKGEKIAAGSCFLQLFFAP